MKKLNNASNVANEIMHRFPGVKAVADDGSVIVSDINGGDLQDPIASVIAGAYRTVRLSDGVQDGDLIINGVEVF